LNNKELIFRLRNDPEKTISSGVKILEEIRVKKKTKSQLNQTFNLSTYNTLDKNA